MNKVNTNTDNITNNKISIKLLFAKPLTAKIAGGYIFNIPSLIDLLLAIKEFIREIEKYEY